MLPVHGALQVRHTHTQRSPQEQELSLLGQRKTRALANKVTDLLGAIAQLGLNVVLVANRDTNDRKAVLVMLHPKRCGQCRHRTLPGWETGATIHTSAVSTHPAASGFTPQAADGKTDEASMGAIYPSGHRRLKTDAEDR